MHDLRFEPLHTASGEHHMRHEEDLFRRMESTLREGVHGRDAVPVLRLYQWEVPTVSLGKSQTPEIALGERWEAWKTDPNSDPHGPGAVVVRPTGGRAVWHEEELTYAVIFPLEHPVFRDGSRSPEEVFGNWLLHAAESAGVRDLSLERGKASRDPLGIGAAPCFASTSRHELKWHGRKWVGSARRLGLKCLLQHGAIRLGPAGDRLQLWLSGRPVVDDRPWGDLPSAEALAAHLEEGMRRVLRGE
ncbi:MAG: hypothetical protein H6686_01455 [Fibrobacteria bacterium]|nr:hypothetical protein [Fibrobacteria bacterium]